MHRIERFQFIPRPIGEVWEFFSDPKNLDEMTPSFLEFEILSGGEQKLKKGIVIEYRILVLPMFRRRWVTEITQCKRNASFIDEQRKGPYRSWRHLHQFESVSGGVAMLDRVDYQLPFGLLGKVIHRLFVKKRIETIFNFRKEYLEKRFSK